MKKWEIPFLLALALTFLWGTWSVGQQNQLAEKVIRLHVIANSDSENDQVLKLQVRDKVLTFAENTLRNCDSMAQASEELIAALPVIEHMAETEIVTRGYDYAVTAKLEETDFPLKQYDGFSLPEGKYLALRLVIGEGRGHNWWCVVYPPLCTEAATDWKTVAQEGGLNESDISLIAERDGYVLKFRSVELWQQLRSWLKK